MSWHLDIGSESPVDGHTYNLTPMWVFSGMVENSTKDLDGLAGYEIARRCERAVTRAIRYAPAFKALNPENGWGDYDGFLEVLLRLWRAAEANPQATAKWNG